MSDKKFTYEATSVTLISTHRYDWRSPLVATLAVVEVQVCQLVDERPGPLTVRIPPVKYQVLSGNAGGCILYVIPLEHDATEILKVANAARLAWREDK